ncbi:hypothetical protein, partial [Mesorhizobium sp. WSM4313]|uniref:hypothetical protein n=1 Tax=Mesorhizobium sp. WSM4313 TaxID=2029412 RepID=UPI001AECD061
GMGRSLGITGRERISGRYGAVAQRERLGLLVCLVSATVASSAATHFNASRAAPSAAFVGLAKRMNMNVVVDDLRALISS